ncbi:hypothetical protein [Streptomyces pacificus]|nr:hypothetical protein [Streptomyces pacificus]
MNSPHTAPVPGPSGPPAAPAPHAGVLAWARRPGSPRSAPRHRGPGELALTPLYGQLLSEWQARGAMLPGARDPQWDRLASPHAFEEDTRRTLRMLRLEREPLPPPADAGVPVPAWDAGPRPAAPGGVARPPAPRWAAPGTPRPRGHDRES